jgi:hypothetical protein
MSEVKVNKLSPRSGTTVTLGDSGDTITIPSGVTFDASSGGLAGTLTTAAQPNITSVGTLTGFTSTGIDDNAPSNSITIDSNENVGIGGVPATVNQRLFIEGNNAALIMAEIKNIGGPSALQITANNGTDARVVFGDLADNGRGRIIYSNSDESMQFAVNNLSEKMRIDSSGNVGIGNSIPGNFNAGANNLVVGSGSGDEGITIYSGSANKGNIYFADASTGTGEYTGFIDYQHSTDSLRFGTNGGITRMVIDSSGNVGIGTSSPTDILTLVGEGTSGTNQINHTQSADSSGYAPSLAMRKSRGSKASPTIVQSGDQTASVEFAGYDGTNYRNTATIESRVDGTPGTDDMPGRLVFSTTSDGASSPSERMRIDSSGNVLIAKTSPSSATTGLELDVAGFFQATRNGTLGLFNRITTDGTLFSFRQNGSEEGTISVSGATVSYNGFTGTHWSRFTDNSKPTILKGTVLESLDEMCDWYNLEFDVITQDADGNDVTTTEKVPHVLTDTQSNGDVITYNHEGTDYQATIVKETDIKHMKSKVSDTVDAKNVYGVFVAYDEDGEGYNDFYVASVGSFVVRIKANETIAKGDLLQSNGDGTAKVQTDDNIKSSSFAKVLSTTIIETYEDGSYLVPCSLMC